MKYGGHKLIAGPQKSDPPAALWNEINNLFGMDLDSNACLALFNDLNSRLICPTKILEGERTDIANGLSAGNIEWVANTFPHILSRDDWGRLATRLITYHIWQQHFPDILLAIRQQNILTAIRDISHSCINGCPLPSKTLRAIESLLKRVMIPKPGQNSFDNKVCELVKDLNRTFTALRGEPRG